MSPADFKGSLNNGTSPTDKPNPDNNGASLLWLPYVIIAVVFVAFLCFSFLRYHKRHRERYQRKLSDQDTKERLKQRTLKHLSLKSYRKVNASNASSAEKLAEPSNADISQTFDNRNKNDFVSTFSSADGRSNTAPVKNIVYEGADNTGRFSGDKSFKILDMFAASPVIHTSPERKDMPKSSQSGSLPIWIASEHFEISSISASSEQLYGNSDLS